MNSNAEESLATQLRWERITGWEREYRFAPPRKWRFDFAWPDEMAVEVEGGSWVNGAHGRGKHFESDCEKYNEAAILGWTVIRVTPAMIEDGRAIAAIRRAWGGP